jgi:hypothetical protein
MEVHRMSLLATAFGTKVAIAALSLVAIGGGTAVAAANGVLPALPSSVQTNDPTSTPTPDGTDAATSTPDPSGTPSPSATKGPNATGPAAFGLCTAYAAGGLHRTSTAYAALLTASQPAGTIADYCAPILAVRSATHEHGPTSTSTPELNALTIHGQSGSAHGNTTSGSHGH